MRVGIVDDHPLFRLGLRQALDHEEGISVAWDVGSVPEARRMLRDRATDVILMDVHLGDDAGGLEATYALVREQPQLKVVMISALIDDVVVRAARRAGAAGYLAKDVRPEQVASALRALATMSGSIGRSGTLNLMERLPRPRAQRIAVTSGVPSRPALLSPREMEVLSEVRAGRTNREIAQRLGISATTVNKHVHKILQKLRVKNRTLAANRLPALVGAGHEMVSPDH
jgi:DNA-binding NarL/FixJ family response regulator